MVESTCLGEDGASHQLVHYRRFDRHPEEPVGMPQTLPVEGFLAAIEGSYTIYLLTAKQETLVNFQSQCICRGPSISTQMYMRTLSAGLLYTVGPYKVQ